MSDFIAVPLEYNLPPNLTQDQLDSHKNFQKWLKTIEATLDLQCNPSHPFHRHPFKLYEIHVLAAQYWRGKLGFLFCEYDIHNKHGQPDSEKLPGVLFIRGGSVVMLIILQPEEHELSDDEYVILTVQPRVAAGSLSLVELPAGTIDDDDASFSGAAVREIKEECELEIRADELVNLTELVLQLRDDEGGPEEPHLRRAVFAASGASDEFNPLFLVRKRMKKEEIDRLRGKLTGMREEGEKITLMIVKLQDLFKVAAHDSKALSALAMYEGLKREGRI